MQDCDVCVTGGGIIGLSIALELVRRGARVTVVERGTMLAEASQAAAGMIAVRDPENPQELTDLAQLSEAGYHEYLGRIETLSGKSVPYQTKVTYQEIETGNATAALPKELTPGAHSLLRLDEVSIDPRELAVALAEAVRATSIRILENTAVHSVSESSAGVHMATSDGDVHADRILYAMGAWSFAPVVPRKGQMLAVRMPEDGTIDYVLRTPHIYAVPRRFGPRAGHLVVGATVEDAGFSKTTDAASLSRLREMAAEFLPMLADEARFPVVDQWAGLRPATPDRLPLLGQVNDGERIFVATGHYRNGIMLAPGTAHAMASLLSGQDPGVDLAAFSPARFA